VSWLDQRAELQAYAETFDKAAVLMSHSHWFWRAVAFVGFWIPKGRFAQTVGPLVGIPDAWSEEQAHRVISHEVGGHVRQFRAFGLWIHPWVGLPLMAVVYGLLFFPIFLAYFRYRLELHADSVKWKTLLKERRSTPDQVRARAQRFATTVASWTYLKPWPAGLVKRGFARKAESVIRKAAANG
jgi:hypothetical protein